MPIVFRPARATDLQQAAELVAASINDLSERHGFGTMATLRSPSFSLFSLAEDPSGLWVAEDAGDLVGFSFSWVCGDLWFLAQLFVSPGRQANGIGRELLRRALFHAQQAGASTRALITFSFNAVSQGLYMRHGMFPRCSIYNLKAERTDLLSRMSAAPLRCAPMENTADQLDRLVQIDTEVLNVSRRKHHQYLLNEGEANGVMLYADDSDDCVGYAYIADGHLGPMAVTQPARVGAAFGAALSLAANSDSAHVSAFVPASCEAALRVAIEAGMRITTPMVLMSTRDFADWTRYLPRNPGFM